MSSYDDYYNSEDLYGFDYNDFDSKLAFEDFQQVDASPFIMPPTDGPGWPGKPGGQPSRPGGRYPEPPRPSRPGGGRPSEPHKYPRPDFDGGYEPGFDSGSAPQSGPPDYIPSKAPGLRAVDPFAIKGCLYNYTYVWLDNRQMFWMYLTFVGRKSVAGYRWTNRGWVYTGFDLDMIDSFYCGGR